MCSNVSGLGFFYVLCNGSFPRAEQSVEVEKDSWFYNEIILGTMSSYINNTKTLQQF